MFDLPEYLFLLSSILLLASSLIVLAFVIPLQIEQAHVKNGLSVLRKMLLIEGAVYIVTNSIALYFMLRGLYRIITTGGDISLNNSLLLLTFSAGYLVLAICAYGIYHVKYIDDYKNPPSS